MVSFAPTSADTLEDQRLYTSARLVEVACLDCLARVGVKKPEGVDEETAQYIGKRYSDTFKEGFEQDVHIWLNKAPVQNPLLCEEDGPVYQLRRWYEQFYVDKADVTAEMTDRFEFEVDTTKANEYWHTEVEENLRRKAEEDGAEAAPKSSDDVAPDSAMTGT